MPDTDQNRPLARDASSPVTAARERRFTAAHWGAYEVRETAGRPELVALDGDPAPSRIGRGWLSAASDRAARIRRPSVRRGWLRGDGGAQRNDDVFVELPWDEALDMAATELARVIARHGNGALFGGSYGWASAGRFHHAQSQLRRFLNLHGGYVGARDTYSHAAAEVVLPYLTGMTNKAFEEGLTSWSSIGAHCTLFLAFGGVSGRTAQIASGGTSAHETDQWLARAARGGMKTVCVSPLRDDIADLPGGRWLPIRPGTDVALMLALCHELFVEERHDVAFLERCTSGWEAFRDHVTGAADGQPRSPRWAAPLCDLPEAEIVALAAELSRERVMISVAWGLQRADHGEQAVWAGLALAALLGQIGQPGTGFGFGYGSTAPPGRPARHVPWPAVPQGRNPIDDFIPVARVADMLLHPGEHYTYDGQTRRYPDIRLVYWAGGNPFHHHQDLLRLERAWTRPETVIVHEHSWTATARRADIVLPCTTPLEREDIMINRRDPELVFMSRVLPVMGEARDDHAIFSALAARTGMAGAFDEGRDVDAWLRWLWGRCREVATREGFTLPDFDAFRRAGRATVPDACRTRVLFGDFVADPVGHPLRTESGRLTLFNHRIAAMDLPDCPPHPSWLEPREWTGAAGSAGTDETRAPDENEANVTGSLHLVSNQPDTRLHAQLDNGSESLASKVHGREVCRLHVDTAARLGLRDGDIVCLRSARGACLAALRSSPAMRRDCVVLPTGAWLDLRDTAAGRIDVHGNPNVLTIDRGASGLSQGNISHTCVVRVSKWTGPVPEVRALHAPRFVSPDDE